VRVVLGPKWEDAIFPVQVMALVIPLRLMAGLMWTAVTAIGRVDIFVQVVLIAGVVFPVCFVVGVQWGLTGLALAWPVAWLLNFLLGLRRLAVPIGLKLSQILLAAAGPVSAGLPMVGAIALTRWATPALSDGLRLPLLIAVGALVYLALITALDRRAWTDLRSAIRATKG
jgi:teichuronic acid exporter